MYCSRPLSAIVSDYIAIRASRPNPKYYLRLNQLADQLIECSFALRGCSLALDVSYYCYVYLDPRHSGQHTYLCPSGKRVTFSHRPFYVGKGKGRRKDMHIVEAASNRGASRKLKILRKLSKLGLEPIIVSTESRAVEALALAYEIDLIAGIGRLSCETGPLTNMTVGGDGASGYEYTYEDRRKMRESQRARFANETQEQKTIRVNKSKATKASRPDVEMERARKISAYNSSAEVKRRKAEITKKQWATPGFKENKIAVQKETWSAKSAESKAEHARKSRAATVRRWANPENLKRFTVRHSDGRIYTGKNTSQFCAENNIKSRGNFRSMLNQKRVVCEGWSGGYDVT